MISLCLSHQLSNSMLMTHWVINTSEDATLLQKDLDALTQWAQKWMMNFNADKCVHLTITRKMSPLITTYIIDNSIIQQKKSANYLGVTITDKLSWSEHIINITNKANSIRALLQRNLHQCQPSVKASCYIHHIYSSNIRICLNCLVPSHSLWYQQNWNGTTSFCKICT